VSRVFAPTDPRNAMAQPRLGAVARRVALALVFAGLGTSALAAEPTGPPAPDPLTERLPDLPDLRAFRAHDAHAAWIEVKDIADPVRQHRELMRRGLQHRVCTDVVDLRALVARGAEGFGFRDDWRGRSWARPSLALVLVEAMRRFRLEHPDKTVALGDISQPGCGQLDHGTLLRHVHGEEARALVRRAERVLGAWVVREARITGDFPSERERFEHLDDRVLVEHTLVAKRLGEVGELTLRVATRRYREQPFRDDERMTEAFAELEGEAALIARRGVRIDRRRVLTTLATGEAAERWVTHWVDRRTRRQLVAVTTAAPGRRLDLATAEELRLSGWRPKQPGSFRGEVRWVRAALVPWERWGMVYEAGHVSHHAGRDADLSYVTADNEAHFAVDLEAMDVPATWRWFELLVATGEELGTPVEMILVDRSVRRHLLAHLPPETRRSTLWRELLRVSPGHDGHHHLRLHTAEGGAEVAAQRRLRDAYSDGSPVHASP